ncbi:MAG: hypothetical protein AB3N28_06880 [Kordiimonas sp.]
MFDPRQVGRVFSVKQAELTGTEHVQALAYTNFFSVIADRLIEKCDIWPQDV